MTKPSETKLYLCLARVCVLAAAARDGGTPRARWAAVRVVHLPTTTSSAGCDTNIFVYQSREQLKHAKKLSGYIRLQPV